MARQARSWEVDIRPVPISFEDPAESRTGTLFVLANGMIVDGEPLVRPSPEPEDMAELLAEAVLRARERLGELPEKIEVRHEPVVQHLVERLAARGIAVEVGVGKLAELDEAAASFIESLVGERPLAFYSRPDTWAGWGLPEEQVERIFDAAAVFYRAAPWEELANVDLLDVVSPSGREWTVCVLGAGGEEYALQLYSARRDIEGLCEGAGMDHFRNLEGRVLTLDFEDGRDVPKRMRWEISRHGWEVAGAAGYPVLMTYETPAGGLLRADAENLLALLGAVPRFLAAGGLELDLEGSAWRDPETGFEVVYRPHDPGFPLFLDSEDLEPADLRVPRSSLALSEDLQPGGAEGPGADPVGALWKFQRPMNTPEAVEEFVEELAALNFPVVERFAEYLAEVEDLAPSTVEKHTRTADNFVSFLTYENGLPLPAVHEKDLREFLWDFHPRQISSSATAARTVPVSLKRFFAYLAAEDEIACPWAAAVLADRESIEKRWASCPGWFWMVPEVQEWRGEWVEQLQESLLVPDLMSAEGVSGQGFPGPMELELDEELGRRWLLWRDEILRSGVRETVEVLTRLLKRQEAWEGTPHPALGGRSPGQAVADERWAMAEVED